MKSKSLLESFTAYCKANPEQRFWQALRNWTGRAFVFVADNYTYVEGNAVLMNPADTFYWEEMNGVQPRKD